MQLRHVEVIVLCITIYSSKATPVGTLFGDTGPTMPKVVSLDVKCGRSGMNVNLAFDKPFSGVIYSKGHFHENKCNYITDRNTESNSFSFYIPVDDCGTKGRPEDPTPDKDTFFENTVIIQNDPLIQEVWDEARNLRCSWQHSFSKNVASKPLKVQEPEKVRVDFDPRSVNTLMQIQKGKSPFSSPATGYVYVGQDTSVVIYVQDSSGKLDANVVSCSASSSKGNFLELIDDNGCLMRPDMMTSFAKLSSPEGVPATMMMYASLKAFQVDQDPNFRMSCQLEVCEGKCLEPCALGHYERSRNRREVPNTELIEVQGGAIVIAKNDKSGTASSCSLPSLIASTVIILVFLCAFLCCVSCYLALKLHVLREQFDLFSFNAK